MLRVISLTLLPVALCGLSLAQSSLTTFGGGPDGIDARESTWIAYFDRPGGKFIGGFTINYNKVEWREEYAEQLETILRDKRWRLGKHFWSTLDTNLPLTWGGVAVEAGYYYLGLARSEDGADWTLILIDAEAARKGRLDAFNIDHAALAYEIPLKFERADENEPQLRMFFAVASGEGGVAEGFVGQVDYRLLFGPYRLSAPVVVEPIV